MVHHFGASGEYHPIPAALLNGAKEVSVLPPPLPAPVPPPQLPCPREATRMGAQATGAGRACALGRGVRRGPLVPAQGCRRGGSPGVPISSPLLAGLPRAPAWRPHRALPSPPHRSAPLQLGGRRQASARLRRPSLGRPKRGRRRALGTPSDLEGGPHLPAADGPPPGSSTWPYAPTSYLSSQAPGSGTAYSSFNGGAARPPSALGPAAPGAGSQAWPYAEATLVGTSTPMDAPKPTPTATAQGPP